MAAERGAANRAAPERAPSQAGAAPAERRSITVFSVARETICSECRDDLGRHAWITLSADKQVRCCECSGLGYLVFLPSGNAALTRRAQKYSVLTAVLLKWSRARNRYERQGLLVEEPALDRAQEECMADADLRALRRDRDTLRRAGLNDAYIARFAARVAELFPGCPPPTAMRIAEHACEVSSDRVGRTAAAKAMEDEPVRLAVVGHVRHEHTPYDRLLAEGHDRDEARRMVTLEVDRVLAEWGRRRDTP